MSDVEKYIQTAEPGEIEGILEAVLKRYAVLYPQWEISTIRLEREGSRAQQIDSVIRFLEKMKECTC